MYSSFKGKLSGNKILITGASMGIGEAAARELANEGADLILTARSEPPLQALCKQLEDSRGISASYIIADLSQPVQVEGLAQKILETDRLDGIIHNAGFGLYGEFDSYSDSDIRKIFEVNFFSVLHLTNLLLPLLRKSPRPTLLMVSSVIGLRSIPGASVYCASKAALNLFTEALRVELKSDSIRVVNVYPGRTRTGFPESAVSTGWRPVSKDRRGMPAEKVAKKLAKAYLKGKRDEYISWLNRFVVWLSFLFPGFVDWGLGKYFKFEMKKRKSSDPASR